MRIYGLVRPGVVNRLASPFCGKRPDLRHLTSAKRVRRLTKPEGIPDVGYPIYTHPKSPYSGQNRRIPVPAPDRPRPKDEIPATLRGVFGQFFLR